MGLFDAFKYKKLEEERNALLDQVGALKRQMDASGIYTYQDAERKLNELKKESSATIDKFNKEMERLTEERQNKRIEIAGLNLKIDEKKTELFSLEEKVRKTDVRVNNATKKLNRIKELYKSTEYYTDIFEIPGSQAYEYTMPSGLLEEINRLTPSVILKLHSMDVKELRKEYKENEKLIDKVLEQYSDRYETKTNKAIYNLMVIAMRAELQNILYSLKYNKLEDAVEKVKDVTRKYLEIAKSGNQTIVSTLTKFVGQIEYLFINSVKIEYNYYVKKEQARQEQLAIREQMRQEAEERKALEQERKRVEQEEEKYKQEIGKLQETLTNAESDDEISKLKARILELQGQLSDVVIKREEIANLQNGKAGNVYIISNLGSFGNDVFKIGMTRRLDPQDRVNELGSASVPFKFDVHSFIFSEDAVSLENELHKRLNSKRLNKVNLRKEFFKVNLDDLEQLVQDIEPTAEFNRTMAAEEYYQSMSTDDVYTSDYQYEYAGIDEEDEE